MGFLGCLGAGPQGSANLTAVRDRSGLFHYQTYDRG
eukprot:COSAG02_NODE_20610_length_823_cov_1.013812_1_plen_35_part_10